MDRLKESASYGRTILGAGVACGALLLATTACSGETKLLPTRKPSTETTTTIPPDQDFYATYLQENLAIGVCSNVVVIWGPTDITPATSYIEGNGAPTPACPEPDTRLAIECEGALLTGDTWDGSWVIRYAFSGGTCDEDAGVQEMPVPPTYTPNNDHPAPIDPSRL